MTFIREVLDLAYPKGPAHTPKPDGDYDKFRDATADNINLIRADVKNTAFIRSPMETDNLDDLEREYGITKNTTLSITERTNILKSIRYQKATTGNDDDLQTILELCLLTAFLAEMTPSLVRFLILNHHPQKSQHLLRKTQEANHLDL